MAHKRKKLSSPPPAEPTVVTRRAVHFQLSFTPSEVYQRVCKMLPPGSWILHKRPQFGKASLRVNADDKVALMYVKLIFGEDAKINGQSAGVGSWKEHHAWCMLNKNTLLKVYKS